MQSRYVLMFVLFYRHSFHPILLQLDSLKDILLSDNVARRGGIDNETLERVRHIDTTTRRPFGRSSPSKASLPGCLAVTPNAAERGNIGGVALPAVEESCESLLDVSDLSFDETQNDVLGTSRGKRRSSGWAEQAQKRRKSRSLGALMEEEGNKVNKVSSEFVPQTLIMNKFCT